MIQNAAQHTLDWYRARLGNITGSMVGVLMKLPRGKKEGFTDTAMNYLYQLAAERAMNLALVNDDDLFSEYLMQVDNTTKAMRFGTEQEVYARDLYQRITGRRVVEVGSCRHRSIPHFASSPDGFYYNEGKSERGSIEIKCPNQSTYMKYVTEVRDSISLMEVKPEYFYQCQSHIICTRSRWTDFIVYCPFQSDPIHIVRIFPVKAEIDRMKERIAEANKTIDLILKYKTSCQVIQENSTCSNSRTPAS